tara:strand:- start:606 stop:1106 length:501 start_codon:yes stop_codon:yes gene_type:complete
MSNVDFKIELQGFEKVKRKLDILYEVDRTKHRQFKNGIKKAANIYIKYMKQELNGVGYTRKVTRKNESGKTVTFKSGALKKSIGYIPSKSQRSLTGYVGARSGKRAGKTFDGYYASIINYGKNPGTSRGRGFADRAYSKGKNTVQKSLEIEVAKILNKTILQLANS